MKIKGVEVKPPKPQVLVIPRDGNDLVFTAQYVESYEEFDKLVPRPDPVKIKRADGFEDIDLSDKTYQEELDRWSQMRINWLYIKSLEPTGIEYDLIRMTEPETWLRFDEEFKIAGFSEQCIEKIKLTCYEVCGVSQTKIDEATERFLAGQAQESKDE